jgi:hypothetical protein
MESHYVASLDNAIVRGAHIVPASTLPRTVSGVVHTFMQGGHITNEEGGMVFPFLQRMMGLIYIHYSQVMDMKPETPLPGEH